MPSQDTRAHSETDKGDIWLHYSLFETDKGDLWLRHSLIERMKRYLKLHELQDIFMWQWLHDFGSELVGHDDLYIYRQFQRYLKPYKKGRGQYSRAEYYGELWLSPESAIAVEMLLNQDLKGLGRREKTKALEQLLLGTLDGMKQLKLERDHLEAELRVYRLAAEAFSGGDSELRLTSLTRR
jgi:hypothetical protein